MFFCPHGGISLSRSTYCMGAALFFFFLFFWPAWPELALEWNLASCIIHGYEDVGEGGSVARRGGGWEMERWKIKKFIGVGSYGETLGVLYWRKGMG